MRERLQSGKIGYIAVSALLFAALFFLSYRDRGSEDRQAAAIVVFGDSSYGNTRDGSGIPDKLAEHLGKTVYNAGFGGTCASRVQQEVRLDYSGDSLSLAALTKAVYADDFGVQQTIKPVPDITVYFGEVIEGLTVIDFSTVEMVLIGHGSNDYYAGAPLDNEEDAMDEYTFAGALRKSLTMLKKVNPDMRIILLTPTYNWHIASNMTCEEFDAGGGILEDYVLKELEVAAEMGVEAIDLYHDFFPHESWDDWKIYSMDGLHPNEEGRTMIAERIADYLESEAR